MTTLRTQALVLRSVDFGESDRILHLLVPEVGRLTAIAKGARRSARRFAGTLDFFNHLRVQIERRRPGTMSRLDQATLIRHFGPLRVEPSRFALGCYLLELLDRLAPEDGSRQDMPRLFAFALDALAAAAGARPEPGLRVVLELRALDALGLRPELRRCVRCGRAPEPRPEIDFHVGEGGPLCGTCGMRASGLLRVHLGTLRALEQALRLPLDRVDRLMLGPQALEEARQLVSRFQRFHLGVELHSERFLDAMTARAASAFRG